MATNIIIAVAAGIQAIFTVVLVIVYVKRQTKIMDKQADISDEQFKFSRYISTLSRVIEFMRFTREESDKTMQEARDITAELEVFIGERHTPEEAAQFMGRIRAATESVERNWDNQRNLDEALKCLLDFLQACEAELSGIDSREALNKATPDAVK